MRRAPVADFITPSLSAPQKTRADVPTTCSAGPYQRPAESSSRTLNLIASSISNKTTSGSGVSTDSYFRSLPTIRRERVASSDSNVFSRMSVEARLAFKETLRNDFNSAQTFIPSPSLPEIVGTSTSFETKPHNHLSKSWKLTGSGDCAPVFNDRNTKKQSVTFDTQQPYLLIQQKQTFATPMSTKCVAKKWSVPRFPVLKSNGGDDITQQHNSSTRQRSGHVVSDDVGMLKRDVKRSQTAGVISDNNFRVTGYGYDSRFVSANQTKPRVYLAQLDDDDVSTTDDVIAKSIAKCTAWLQSIVS